MSTTILEADRDVPSRLSTASEAPPSALQQLVGELFRIALCRNDDYHLASSSVLKQLG
jgi:hypothetical protein